MSKFGWFVAGIGLGAVAGVLYAPKTGSETRAELLSSASEAKEKGAVLARQTADAAGEYAQRGKEYLEHGKALANDHLANASSAVIAAKEAYAQGASSDLQSPSSETSS